MICGKKTNTEPTPPIIPSTNSDCSGPDGTADSATPPSAENTPSMAFITGSAQLKIDWTMKPMISTRIAGPVPDAKDTCQASLKTRANRLAVK